MPNTQPSKPPRPPGAGGRSVPDRLQALGDLFAERNALYRDSWHETGAVMDAFFPYGLALQSPEDFGRFVILQQMIGKLHRYALMFDRGGHVDSLDDLAVYAQMLQELDGTINKENDMSIDFGDDNPDHGGYRPVKGESPSARPASVPNQPSSVQPPTMQDQKGNSYSSVRDRLLTDPDLQRQVIAAGNLLSAVCYNLSVEAGWWSNNSADNPLIVPTKITLTHSELSEAMEGHRIDADDQHLPHRKSVDVELADAVIRIADLCGHLKSQLGNVVLEKLVYNQTRRDHQIDVRAKVGGKRY